MLGISPVKNWRKIILFGSDSICKREIVAASASRYSPPRDSRSYIGTVGSVNVSHASHVRNFIFHNIPEPATSSSWVLEQHFRNTAAVVLCFDYHNRFHLSPALVMIRAIYPVGPIILAFHTPIELPAYDEEALTPFEQEVAGRYRVTGMFFSVGSLDIDEFKDVLNQIVE